MLTAAVALAVAAGVVGAGALPAAAATKAAAKPAAAVAGALLPAPSGDRFYVPPSPLPAGRPGDVIWARRVTLANFAVFIQIKADAYQVLYLSTDALGKPNAVSGTVLVPKGKAPGTVPIVGLADGTQGIGDQCAPSKELLTGADYGAIDVDNVINRGWAVAYTDYEGLGTPGDHTYVVGRSEGHAVIDSVRAAQRLGVGLSPTAKVAFYGYSQGGGAAAWAGELQPAYAPELNLKGISAGGIPGDLIAVAKALDGGPGFSVLAMAAVGFDAAYPELDLDKYLNTAGRARFDQLKSLCLPEALVALTNLKITDLTTTNPLNDPKWIARLNENKLGSNPPKAPMFMYHAYVDELVDPGQAEALHTTYCKAGANITWSRFLGEHGLTFIAQDTNALNFISDRFAGKPTAGNC